MNTLKRLPPLTLLAISPSTIAHLYAQPVTTAYSIQYKETHPMGRTSAEVLARIPSEKLRELLSGSPRERFEGQRANGDHVQVIKLGDQETRSIEFHDKGTIVSANNKNSSISTMGNGTSHYQRPVTPTCGAFIAVNTPPDRDTDVILGFNTLHIARDSPT